MSNNTAMDYIEILLKELKVPTINVEEVKRQVERILKGLGLV